MDNPGSVIVREYGGSKNPMTPNIVRYGWVTEEPSLPGIKAVAYEVSEGRGIYDERIYGLTIVALMRDSSTQRESERSTICHSMNQIERQLEKIRAYYNEEEATDENE